MVAAEHTPPPPLPPSPPPSSHLEESPVLEVIFPGLFSPSTDYKVLWRGSAAPEMLALFSSLPSRVSSSLLWEMKREILLAERVLSSMDADSLQKLKALQVQKLFEAGDTASVVALHQKGAFQEAQEETKKYLVDALLLRGKTESFCRLIDALPTNSAFHAQTTAKRAACGFWRNNVALGNLHIQFLLQEKMETLEEEVIFTLHLLSFFPDSIAPALSPPPPPPTELSAFHTALLKTLSSIDLSNNSPTINFDLSHTPLPFAKTLVEIPFLPSLTRLKRALYFSQTGLLSPTDFESFLNTLSPPEEESPDEQSLLSLAATMALLNQNSYLEHQAFWSLFTPPSLLLSFAPLYVKHFQSLLTSPQAQAQRLPPRLLLAASLNLPPLPPAYDALLNGTPLPPNSPLHTPSSYTEHLYHHLSAALDENIFVPPQWNHFPNPQPFTLSQSQLFAWHQLSTLPPKTPLGKRLCLILIATGGAPFTDLPPALLAEIVHTLKKAGLLPKARQLAVQIALVHGL